VQDALEEKFGAFECEIGDVEVQWNNKEKGAVDTTSDLLVKVERRARKRRKCSVKWMEEGSGRMFIKRKGREKQQKSSKFLPVHTTSQHCPCPSCYLFIKLFEFKKCVYSPPPFCFRV